MLKCKVNLTNYCFIAEHVVCVFFLMFDLGFYFDLFVSKGDMYHVKFCGKFLLVRKIYEKNSNDKILYSWSGDR